MSNITYNRGSNLYLTPHFARREFDCKCGCATTKHDTELSARLEKLRVDLGAPITITSAYRCATHNKAVGGSSGSKHLTGGAADIKCAAVNPVALGILARKYFAGVGVYWYGTTAFVHVDTRGLKCTWLKSYAGEPYRYTTLSALGAVLLPTVRQDCTGAVNQAAVRMLQRLLGLAVDGAFGANTKAALMRAQAAHGCTIDGVCGPETWEALAGVKK